MKKAVLVYAALLIMAVFVSAATTVNFGIKAGASSSNNKWSDDDGTEKSVVKPTFGAFAVINLSPTISLQPEVNYLVMGEQWDVTDGNAIEEFTYLHVPVLLKVRLVKKGDFVPVVFTGTGVSFLLSAKDSGEDVKDYFRSVDIGVDIGAGLEIALGKMKALLDARYYLGLSNMYSGEGFSMKNRSFVLAAGLIF